MPELRVRPPAYTKFGLSLRGIVAKGAGQGDAER